MKKSELKSIIKEIIAQEMALDDQPHMRVYRGTAVDEHDESDMNNPVEKREVQIGGSILRICKAMADRYNPSQRVMIEKLATELIKMHGAQ